MVTYIKNDYNSDSDLLSKLNISKNPAIEISWIVSKPPNMRTMVMGLVYRPPGADFEAFM